MMTLTSARYARRAVSPVSRRQENPVDVCGCVVESLDTLVVFLGRAMMRSFGSGEDERHPPLEHCQSTTMRPSFGVVGDEGTRASGLTRAIWRHTIRRATRRAAPS